MLGWKSRRSLGAVYGMTVLAALISSGCSRQYWRRQADREAYCLVQEKSNDPRWDAPGFTVEIDPRSRYFDPFDPDCPPLPPDDPASHRYMHYVDSKRGWRRWHECGDRRDLENPNWNDLIGEYAEITEEGAIRIDLDDAVAMAYLHSPDWQTQLETIYLSALDVSTERFRFDTQFFAGTGPTFTHVGRLRSPAGESNTLQLNTDAQLRRRFATGGELLVGFANSFIWQFAGPDTNATTSLLNFSLVQPLLRAGGRAVALEQLTITERALLANLRALERYRHGFFTNVAVGDAVFQGPQRRGGFFGGTGLTGFTGQGSGGFGDVGSGRGGFFGAGGAAGGAGGGGAIGAAGGGAGIVGGFVGLLQQGQQIRNTQDSLNLQLRTLELLEANFEAGLIDLVQVEAFRQSIETARANLLQAQTGFENQFDTFKRTTLGLPPDLPMVLDDSMIEQFRFIDARMTDLQSQFAELIDRVGDLPAEPPIDELERVADEIEQLRREVGQRFELVRASLNRLASVSEARQQTMSPAERSLFEADIERLAGSLVEFEARYVASGETLEALRAGLTPETRGRIADRLVALASSLSGLTQELSLVQARARLDSVTLEPVELEPVVALDIARANRLDWMNNRAALVDTWRLIFFNANALRSNLTVTFSGDVANVGDNPFDFRGQTGTLRTGLRFDPPFTRLLERNNYRSVLITYQRDRRQLIQFEDQVNQTLRQTLRTLEQLELNLEIQRRAVAIAVRRVDQTREELSEPPPPTEPGQPPAVLGPTAAQNLLSAVDALSAAQNNFMSVWLNHYATRMALMRELGIMRLDERGVWIDMPIEQALMSVEQPCGLPPAVPDEWLFDAGLDPAQVDEAQPGEEIPLPEGQSQPGARPPAPGEPANVQVPPQVQPHLESSRTNPPLEADTASSTPDDRPGQLRFLRPLAR